MPSRKSSKAPEQLGLGWYAPGLVAGVDEAGRGPLAGPVVAAAVILDDLKRIAGLADSKALTARRRERLADEIRARALCVSVGQASVEEIDRLNILQATLLAMRRAVEGLRLVPQQVLVDGNRLPVLKMPAEAIVKGDAKVAVISAASIIAKVERDRLCAGLHAQWPQYGFDGHKGYPTPEHLEALRQHGACPAHRRSYAPVRAVIEGRMNAPRVISSRHNPLVARVRRLAQDGGAYRRAGEVWLEGEHLCGALRARGRPALQSLVAESGWASDAALRDLAGWAPQVNVVADAVFAALSGLESPARIGFLVAAPAAAALAPRAATVVLDRLQDAGNVGSLLRSAAALGVAQVLALKGTAALWSPKVLRAGQGAHFALALAEGLDEAALDALQVPLVATSPHAGTTLRDAALPRPCAWVFGHEGQGVAPSLAARCALTVRIPQPGGEESLNVAAAAAICLYESASR